jgi:hypothetical protein
MEFDKELADLEGWLVGTGKEEHTTLPPIALPIVDQIEHPLV